MKVTVIGNCQSDQIGLGLMLALSGIAEVDHHRWNDSYRDPAALAAQLRGSDLLVTNLKPDRFEGAIAADRLLQLPELSFGGYHPDSVILSTAASPGTALLFWGCSPASALGYWAYARGLKPAEAERRFTLETFTRLGYLSYFDSCLEALQERFSRCDMAFGPLLDRLNGQEVPWWGVNHPKMALSLVLVEELLRKLAIRPAVRPTSLIGVVPDPLENEFAWGCYPPLAEHLGVPGSWSRRHYNTLHLTTGDYLEAFYGVLDSHRDEGIGIYHRDRRLFELATYDHLLEGA